MPKRSNLQSKKNMKTEEEFRNSRDNTDEKIIEALEYAFDSVEVASTLLQMINDPAYDKEDIRLFILNI